MLDNLHGGGNKLTYDPIFLKIVEQANQEFSGWDFSFISQTGRVQSDSLPWSYGSRLLCYMQSSNRMLDMGTGGGEFLSHMKPLPHDVYATEAYKPNIPVAKERLQPIGVQVVEIDDDTKLPFSNAYFDLIANQHESYSVNEVRRLLHDKGVFITQQVGGLDCKEINAIFDVPLNDEYICWNLKRAADEIREKDFHIAYSQEAYPIQRFYDVGALIYYLKAIPWQVPGLKVWNELDTLYTIHKIIQSAGYFEVTQHRFIIIAEAL